MKQETKIIEGQEIPCYAVLHMTSYFILQQSWRVRGTLEELTHLLLPKRNGTSSKSPWQGLVLVPGTHSLTQFLTRKTWGFNSHNLFDDKGCPREGKIYAFLFEYSLNSKWPNLKSPICIYQDNALITTNQCSIQLFTFLVPQGPTKSGIIPQKRSILYHMRTGLV